jgi:catechol 2,3-dioxygenase-like lactoylglutathione lyase family enzyme
MKIYKISAITLNIEDMERSCRFYSQIPGFKLVYGGTSNDTFTTFEIGEEEEEEHHILKMCLNLELAIFNNNHEPRHKAENGDYRKRQHFGRIIFHTEDVDRLYSYFKSNKTISNLISFENEPTNAAWGERYFHIREPDGYQLSFATTITDNKENKKISKA